MSLIYSVHNIVISVCYPSVLSNVALLLGDSVRVLVDAFYLINGVHSKQDSIAFVYNHAIFYFIRLKLVSYFFISFSVDFGKINIVLFNIIWYLFHLNRLEKIKGAILDVPIGRFTTTSLSADSTA